MSDADVGFQAFAHQHFFELGYFSFLFINVEAAVVQERHAAAVVAAIFKSFKSFKDDGVSLSRARVTYYSAHNFRLS